MKGGATMIKWEKIAEEMFYASPKDMLLDLYNTRQMSSNQIGNLLKASGITVLLKMKALDIPIRQKTCKGAEKEKLMPPQNLS